MSEAHPALLVTTCEASAWVAAFTIELLHRFWPAHPPVFTCGTASPLPGGTALPAKADPADWMGIARDGVRELRRRGFGSAYLILDDHPPIGRCSEEHLNGTLPQLLVELDAGYIGLNGWGQGRDRQGEELGSDRYRMERVPPSFPWRFSLHPGLWRLKTLDLILESLGRDVGIGERSAWAFERRSGRPGALDGVEERLGGTYRVCGEEMAHPESRLARPLLLASSRRLAGVGSRGARLAGLAGAAKSLEARARFLYRYYRGPYPLYWSGLLQRGRPHRDMIRFLRLFDGTGLAREFLGRAGSGGGAP